jgi:hypothetical protein
VNTPVAVPFPRQPNAQGPKQTASQS